MRGAYTALTIALAPGLSMFMSACAWDAGEPFATVTPHLEARVHTPEGRDVGMGWQKLASEYQVRFDRMELDTGEITLIDTGLGALGFDPANPPAGYSLCHNGHCHSDDGRLVAYQDIAAELAQGSAARRVLAMPVGALDLVAGESRPLFCVPDCDLPLAEITVGNLDVARVQAAGLVRDGLEPARIDGEVAWTLDWTLDVALADDGPLVMTGSVDLIADRSHDPDVRLELELLISSKILDDVPWAELGSGPFALDTGADARAAVLQALSEVALDMETAR
jgi:hypothetical protein